jgi:hypothetical protein
MHNKRMSPYEKIELLEAIRAQVQAAWRTDEIRRQKPTPQVRYTTACDTQVCLLFRVFSVETAWQANTYSAGAFMKHRCRWHGPQMSQEAEAHTIGEHATACDTQVCLLFMVFSVRLLVTTYSKHRCIFGAVGAAAWRTDEIRRQKPTSQLGEQALPVD